MHQRAAWIACLWMGCSGAQPCVKQCKNDEAFFEQCWSTFREAGLNLSCYDQVEGMADALTEAGDDPVKQAAVYQEWRTAGRSRPCKSAAELTDQCVILTKAEFKGLSDDAKDTRADECDPDGPDTGAPDPVREAIDNDDCGAFMEALGIP